MNDQVDSTSSWRASLTKNHTMPGYLILVYVVLLVTLGWGLRKQGVREPELSWQYRQAPFQAALFFSLSTALVDKENRGIKTVQQTVIPDLPLAADELPPLIYRTHVYTSEPSQRSITLNGQSYQEGDIVLPGLTVESIQHDLTVFDFAGQAFALEALEDWPGGKVKEQHAEISSRKTN